MIAQASINGNLGSGQTVASLLLTDVKSINFDFVSMTYTITYGEGKKITVSLTGILFIDGSILVPDNIWDLSIQ